LDTNRPQPLAALYAAPDSNPRLSQAVAFGSLYLFKIAPP